MCVCVCVCVASTKNSETAVRIWPVVGPEEEGDRTHEFVLLYMLLGCSL